jgi:hypothetical protein
MFLLFLSLSLILLTNYTGYDINWPWFTSDEEDVDRETINYLEEAGAKKIYAVNPIFPALSSDLESSLAIDSFALIWLEGRPSDEIIKDRINEGVDYIVLDSWVKYWGYPYSEQASELTQAVRRYSRLMTVIEPDSPCSTEIYLLGAEKQAIFNGDFEQWVTSGETSVPVGWQPVLVTGEGDFATIRKTSIDGVECAAFAIYEDGLQEADNNTTHAGISQQIPFPESKFKVKVYPTRNTRNMGNVIIGPGIHFADEYGHALIIGFSDEVEGEEIYRFEDGNRILVLENARLNQWSEHTIDVPYYWQIANWQQPEEIDLYLVVSTYYTEPGFYAFHVAGIETEAVLKCHSEE